MSSIEIGSSATSNSGPNTIARAMTARCFWPPDSSDGYFGVNRLGRGEPDPLESRVHRFGAIVLVHSVNAQDIADSPTDCH